jgi:hypothetical protein
MFPLPLALTSLLALVPAADAGQLQSQLEAAPEIVWVGLDYSKVRIFTPEVFDNPDERVYWDPGGGLGDVVTHFAKAKDAWTQLISDWNSMAVAEIIEPLEQGLQHEITVDLMGPAGPTKRTGEVFFESIYDAKKVAPELNQEAIQALVKTYRTKAKKGIGIAFVMDRLSYPEKEACAWPTFFDLEKKTIIQTERICKKPGGSGYRNYWLNIVPSIVKDYTKAMKKGEF